MATAHIIQVPVESLEIIELPGITTFEKYTRGYLGEKRMHTKLTLKSKASSQTFERRIIVEYVAVGVTAEEFVETVSAVLDYRSPEGLHTVRFICVLSGQRFIGEYDYGSHSGHLRVYENPNPEDDEDYEYELPLNLQ